MLITAAIVLVACNKDETPTPDNNNPPDTTNSNTPDIGGVYIAGDSFDVSNSNLPYPVYWRNGKEVHLPNATYSSATGIALSDSNVYVSSSGHITGNNVTYWKNGLGINLADPSIISPSAKALTVSGKDVYVTGISYINNFQRQVPIYWKNQDQAIKITNCANPEVNAITVSGSDVYIAGASSGGIGTNFNFIAPCYWKNGTPTYLVSPKPLLYQGVAKSIYISGSDIYVVGDVSASAGALTGGAVCWKNGTPTELTTSKSHANCVVVAGNDVYIAGVIYGTEGNPHAAYWKNGVAVILDPNYHSAANAIAVDGNDVYVAGNRGLDLAMYWKNGNPVILGKGRANASVVRK